MILVPTYVSIAYGVLQFVCIEFRRGFCTLVLFILPGLLGAWCLVEVGTIAVNLMVCDRYIHFRKLLKVTGKHFAHATGPLVNNVKLRTISSGSGGSPGQIFSRQVLGWTAQ